MVSGKDFKIKQIDLSNPTPEIAAKILDKDWRVANFYKITDKNGSLIPFTRNRAQEHFNQNKVDRNIVLKSRQLGFTTDACIDMLDDVLFSPNFHALLIAQDDPSALDLFDTKINLPFLHFPLQKNYEVDTDRANKLKVNFGNNEFSEISVKSSGRSATLNRVHISEFGKICAKYPLKAKEIISGTIPAVPLNGKITIESTAEGDKGMFCDMFWDAWSKPPDHKLRPTEYKAHFYNWQWDDGEIAKILLPDAQIPKEFTEYQAKHNELAKKHPNQFSPISDIQLTYYFYKWIQLGKDWNKLRQEYPTTPEEAFVSSGDKLFDLHILDDMIRNLPPQSPTEAGSWLIYDPPQSGHIYALGADPAGGGRHHSAAAIWDFTPKIPKPKVVATFKNNQITPDMFAFELKSLASRYNGALIAVERNNHGYATITELKRHYPIDLLFKFSRTDQSYDKESDKIGFDMNLATKPKIVYDMVTAIREKLVDIPSKELLVEMRSFDRQNVQSLKDDPEETAHHDLLMAAMIGFHLRDYLDTYSQEVTIISPSSQSHFDPHAAL